MKLIVKSIKDVDFKKFGSLYELGNDSKQVCKTIKDGWSDGYTRASVIDTPTSLGMTRTGKTPFYFDELERHFHSQEAIFCIDEPIVFVVAPPSFDEHPDMDQAIAVKLDLGMVAVIDRMVWHSAAHGYNKECYYYWLCQVVKNEPSEWKELQVGKIEVIKEEI
ncbi:MAG: hypothetical protein ACK5KR_05425 [Breznakia sp.]